jgi:hypothetical protein
MTRLNAKRKSLENIAYMKGFTAELQYPSQNNTEKSIGFMQSSQNGRIRYKVKKGSQHTINIPKLYEEHM